MADNVVLDPGAGGDTIAADDVAGVKYQVVKLAVGADGAASLVANANPVPISDAGTTVSVDDGSSTLSIDDGGSSITVDGTVGVSGTVTVDSELTTADLDTGAGSDTRAVVGLVVGASGGGVLVSTTNPLPIGDNGGSITVDGSVTANAGTNLNTSALALESGGNLAGAATSLALIDDAVFAEDTAAQAAAKGIAILAVRRDADTSLVDTDNDYANLQVNAAGSLKVAITAGAGSGGTSIADGASFTRDTTSITPAGAAVESSAPTLTNGDVAALSMTTGGALRVAVASGGVSGKVDDAAFTAATDEGVLMMGVASADTVDANDAGALAMTTARELKVSLTTALPAGTNAIGKLAANSGVDIGDVDVTSSALPTGAATSANQSTEITSLQLIDDPVFADDAAFTIGTSKVMVAGFTADESSTDSLDEGDAGAARITLDRKLIVTPYAHAAAGGATPFYNLDSDETEDAIKASAGKLMSLVAINRSTGVRYLKFYNATVANVTVGSTTPVLVIPLPTMGDTNGAGVALPIPSCGIQFDTAITVAATTGFADADTGAPGTNDVIVSGAYI